ncbi:hypothetical protein [Spiroplasma attinicola]|uniref:hypothetical protein n=1 Tax=Spiroplasma attinicola TaxID=2904537 RepID=UPI0020229E34|nr:hypothetical protein [Spiroplasma sp. JKS002670]MCL8209783.1 hypothetical protein [Spiroplasma sp. JKS002670]
MNTQQKEENSELNQNDKKLRRALNLSKRNIYPRSKVKKLLKIIIAVSGLYYIQELAEKTGKDFGLLKEKSFYDLEIINYIIASEFIKPIPRTQKKESKLKTQYVYDESILSHQAFYEITKNSIKRICANGLADPSVDIKFYPIGLTDKGYYFLHPMKLFLKNYKYWFTTIIAVAALIVSIFK